MLKTSLFLTLEDLAFSLVFMNSVVLLFKLIFVELFTVLLLMLEDGVDLSSNLSFSTYCGIYLLTHQLLILIFEGISESPKDTNLN